jgi:hypothetical protein
MIILLFAIPAVAFALAVALHLVARSRSMSARRRRGSTPPARLPVELTPLPPGEVGWTALDDRQLVRLLNDSA